MGGLLCTLFAVTPSHLEKPVLQDHLRSKIPNVKRDEAVLILLSNHHFATIASFKLNQCSALFLMSNWIIFACVWCIVVFFPTLTIMDSKEQMPVGNRPLSGVPMQSPCHVMSCVGITWELTGVQQKMHILPARE